MTPPPESSSLLSDTEQLARQALVHWGGTVMPLLLKHRENAVYRVELTEGRPAVLRVHRPGYHTDAALLSELRWMGYLQANGFPTPSPLPASDGSLLVHVATPAVPEGRQVDCLSWVEGKPLGESRRPLDFGREEGRRIFAALGATIARMHNLTTAWPLPPDFTRHAWDFAGFFGPQPTWGEYEHSTLLSDEARQIVSLARTKAIREFASYERSGRNFGLIHADFVRENILVKNGDVQIIDYDDCGFGWHMYDIAVALYQNLDEPDFAAIRHALLAGYSSQRRLEARDVQVLPAFLTLRAFALIGWMQSRADSETARSAGSGLSSRAVSVAARYLMEDSAVGQGL